MVRGFWGPFYKLGSQGQIFFLSYRELCLAGVGGLAQRAYPDSSEECNLIQR